jgi:CRP/FNR family transcriptional regulator, cyclic AMP receptor protein
VPLLSSLSKAELGRVLALGDEVEFFPGKVIVEAGDVARDFYLLLAGSAKLTVAGKRSQTLGPGDYFGEMAVLDGGPRTATIVALTPVSALRIDRSDFLSLLKVNSSISRKILIELTGRLRASEAGASRH